MTVLWHGSAGRRICAAALALALAAQPLCAVTLNDLLTDSPMTPKRFADYFEDFDFVLFDQVQDPEVFLRTERGNCQDYAILGDYVLTRRG